GPTRCPMSCGPGFTVPCPTAPPSAQLTRTTGAPGPPRDRVRSGTTSGCWPRPPPTATTTSATRPSPTRPPGRSSTSAHHRPSPPTTNYAACPLTSGTTARSDPPRLRSRSYTVPCGGTRTPRWATPPTTTTTPSTPTRNCGRSASATSAN